jgi:hypothetical protein
VACQLGLQSSQLNIILFLDYEIFRLHDEITATEGLNVTFYGIFLRQSTKYPTQILTSVSRLLRCSAKRQSR